MQFYKKNQHSEAPEALDAFKKVHSSLDGVHFNLSCKHLNELRWQTAGNHFGTLLHSWHFSMAQNEEGCAIMLDKKVS